MHIQLMFILGVLHPVNLSVRGTQLHNKVAGTTKVMLHHTGRQKFGCRGNIVTNY